jgi:acetyl-CoA synthetase
MGEEGQLVIRTGLKRPLGIFGGYYRDETLTRTVWHDDIYYTGDMAWRDEDGCYWFVGRSDDVIKSSGYRIGPFEVESALLEHPAVLECAVTGAPDPDRGAVVKATVVLVRGRTPSDELKKELQDHVKKTTAPYKYPRIVEFVEELPKTISGKIRRVQIRENPNQDG